MDLLSSGNFRAMLIIFGLMLVLLQTVSCVDQNCTFNQTETCYAALGDKLSLRMFQDIHIIKLELKKEETLICKIQNNVIKKLKFYENRSDVIGSNDTVSINNVTRADSGRYTLKLTDSQGKETSAGLQVKVEAPIGSVNVSVECISGVRWASCSSEGDSLFFNWTLNGQTLPQDNKTTINLNGNTSGNLICSVKNHISHGEKSITVDHCPGTTTASVTTHLTSTDSTSAFGTNLSASNLTHTQNPGLLASLKLEPVHLIGMASSIVILILLVITVCYIYKKKKQPKSAAADGGTELVYADINHDKLNRDNKPKKTEMSSAADVEYAEVANQRKTKKKKMKEDEVQYGEVTFTPGGRNVQKQRMEQDDCVYSQIYQQK
ncbi:uncharacterized protein [Paramisgurnus dabryanus]|uniref:uncharacterized protein isoform X2 n=1 Tax=Paramisgurnus dabryanus TaxID=90735 RepID=UPI003CCF9DEE